MKNPDLISREAAIQAVNNYDYNGYEANNPFLIVRKVTYGCADELRKLPSIEAIPVVRCQKCRHARELTCIERMRFSSDCVVCMYSCGAGNSYPEYSMDGRVVLKYDYCSYGEQKPDGGETDAE